MPTSKVHPARSVLPAAANAKTPNSPGAGKGLPQKARKPASLPKSDGDAGVQAYIASMEPWQAAIAKRVDALVVKHLPGVRKAVRWHCPFYGVEGQDQTARRRTRLAPTIHGLSHQQGSRLTNPHDAITIRVQSGGIGGSNRNEPKCDFPAGISRVWKGEHLNSKASCRGI